MKSTESLVHSKNNLPKKQKWFYICFIILVFLTITTFFYSLLRPYLKNDVTQLTAGWEYFVKDHSDLRLNSAHVSHIPNVKPSEEVIMEKELPVLDGNANLVVIGQHHWIKVFLDQELLTQYTSSSDNQHKDPGFKLVSVQLPKDYAGKKVRIAISSPYRTYAGVPAQVYFGSPDDLNAYFFSSAIPQIFILTLSVFLGIATLVYAGIFFRQTKILDHASIILSFFAISLGFESMIQDQISGLLFSPLVHSFLSNFLTMLVPLLLITYYWLKMDKYRNFYLIWVALTLFTCVISLILNALGVYDLPELMGVINSIFLIGTLLTALFAIGEAYNRNRFYVICTSGIVAAAIIHCFIYMQSALGGYTPMINWSALVFVGLMLLFCSYSIHESFTRSTQIKKNLQFLQLKTSLLEEGHTSLVNYLNEAHQLRLEHSENLKFMKKLSEEEHYHDLKQHIDDLLKDDIEHKKLISFCQDETINLILQHYQKQAHQRSIDTTFTVELEGPIPMSEPDLLSLLETILEKAIKETRKVSDPRQRKLSLQILVHDGLIDICCENTSYLIENIFEHRIDTSTEDENFADVHLIQSIADRYSSNYSYESSEKTNRLSIQVTE